MVSVDVHRRFKKREPLFIFFLTGLKISLIIEYGCFKSKNYMNLYITPVYNKLVNLVP